MNRIHALLKLLYIVEIIACVTGFVYWKKVKDTYWKWFSVFLAFIVVAETFGFYTVLTNDLRSNGNFFIYFVIPCNYLFYYWLFLQFFKKNGTAWLPKMFTVIYMLSLVFDISFFSKHKYWFFSISYTVGNMLLVLLILVTFFKVITKNLILEFRESMFFWVCSGLLIFYLGTLPYFGLRNVLVSYMQLNNGYSNVMYFLDAVMYMLFTFSFIWGKPSQN